MAFHNKWWECAPSSKIVNGVLVQAVAPTREEIDQFINTKLTDPDILDDIYHRFTLTGGANKGMLNWAKKQFFFRNATPQQVQTICETVLSKSFIPR